MKLKALAAIAVAGIMVMSVPMVAMADTDIEYPNGCTEYINDDKDTLPIGSPDGVIKVKGDVNTTGYAISVLNKNAQVEGNVRANTDNQTAIYSNGVSNWVHVSGEVKDSGSGNAIVASNGTEVTVGSATNGVADQNSLATINASGTGTTVTIKADEATGATGAVINKGNGVAIEAKSGATVTAGDVKAKNTAIEVNGATVNVGNVTLNGSHDSMMGVGVSGNNSRVKVGDIQAINDRDLTTGLSIYLDNNSDSAIITTKDITVTGDKGVVGIDISATKEDNSAMALVDGNISSTGVGAKIKATDGKTVLVTTGTVSGDEFALVIDKDSDTDCIEIVAYELKTSASGNLIGKTTGQEIEPDIKENVATTEYDSLVNYIIKKAAGSESNVTVSGTEEKTVSIDGTTTTYDTAKQGTKISVKVADGYELKAGTIQVVQNADGTYSVVVPRGGGVTLEAIMKAVQSAGGGASFTSTPTSQGSASAPITSGSWAQASNGKFTYTNNGEKLINCTAWIQYTDANGEVVTGKFCFDNSGYMIANTWKEVQSGVWNYFGNDGKMVVNTTTPDGYVVDANGEWRK